MINITIECPRGLQTQLIDILKPIKLNKTISSDKNKSIFEFIGVEDNPVEKLKAGLNNVFDYLNIIEID